MTTFDKLKNILEGEVGYRESGTNHQKYSPAVPGLEWSQNQPWCATFDAWGYLKAGLRPDVDFPVTASCLAGVAWYKKKGRWSSSPKLGSQVFYGPNGGTHVEIVIGISSSSITTIGGNTSGSLGGTYFNGDGVYKKTVARSNSRIYGYGTPFNLDQEDDMPLTKADAKTLLSADVVPAPINPATGKTLNPDNEYWTSESYFKNIFEEVRTVRREMAAMAANLKDVDTEALAEAILSDLTPERIAAAVPKSIAKDVADELTRRLAE